MKLYKSPYESFDPKLAEQNYGEFMRQQWNRYPDNVFIDAISGVQYTGRECANLSFLISLQLQKLGIIKGDIVAICATNTVRTPILLSSVWSLNAVGTGLDFGFREDEYIELASVYKPVAFVCTKENREIALKVKNALPCIKFLIILDDDSVSSTTSDGHLIVPFGAIIAPLDDSTDAANEKIIVDADLLAYMPRTSGTTGRSKVAMHTHRNLMSSVLMQGAADVIPWPKGSIVMASSSLHHVYCLFDIFGSCLYRGLSFLHAQTNDAKLIMKHIEKFRVHSVMTTPYVILSMLNLFKVNDPIAVRIDVSSLRAIVVASNIFPAHSLPFLRECLPELTSFGNCYGQTEIVAAFSHRYSGFENPCAIGHILANGEFRIVSPETLQDVSEEGKRGELWVRLPTTLIGYYNDEKSFQDAFVDGWYRTGDICTVDSQGYVMLVDRLKEFIKTKYTTISPGEVEAKILKHPKVNDVAVVGLPHPLLQTALHAIVAPNSPLTEDELHRYMEENAPDIYKLEGGITICDAVPRTPMGKLMRRTLVQWVLDRKGKNENS